jgi:elongation factor G
VLRGPKVVIKQMDEFPLQIAVEATAGQERLDASLAKLAAEDPSFGFATDPESGQTILKGVSEDHLEAKIAVLGGACNIAIKIGAPQVAYRETLRRKIFIAYTHKKLTSGIGQFATVKMEFAPNARGAGNTFASAIFGVAAPKEYVGGVEKGFNAALGAGALADFPVVDVKATLLDAGWHETDSTPLAFEIASRLALREALQKGGALLEPIMKAEVVTPPEFADLVIRDLAARRGLIEDRASRAGAVIVNAMVPLANTFGYANTLSRDTRGRASFTLQFAHYGELPSPDDDEQFPPAFGMRA